MDFLAERLSAMLGRPVLDKTDLTGSYDFHVKPPDEANVDITNATFEEIGWLGLQLKSGKGLVEFFVVDTAAKPTKD